MSRGTWNTAPCRRPRCFCVRCVGFPGFGALPSRMWRVWPQEEQERSSQRHGYPGFYLDKSCEVATEPPNDKCDYHFLLPGASRHDADWTSPWYGGQVLTMVLSGAVLKAPYSHVLLEYVAQVWKGCGFPAQAKRGHYRVVNKRPAPLWCLAAQAILRADGYRTGRALLNTSIADRCATLEGMQQRVYMRGKCLDNPHDCDTRWIPLKVEPHFERYFTHHFGWLVARLLMYACASPVFFDAEYPVEPGLEVVKLFSRWDQGVPGGRVCGHCEHGVRCPSERKELCFAQTGVDWRATRGARRVPGQR